MNRGKKCLIYERMRIEYQRIEEEILSIERQLEGLPEGSLTCARNGKPSNCLSMERISSSIR